MFFVVLFFVCLLFCFLAEPRGLWILVPCLRIEPGPPALKVQGPDHQTARKYKKDVYLMMSKLCFTGNDPLKYQSSTSLLCLSSLDFNL